MNLFFDTNILYKDPFFSGMYYNNLLNFVKEKEIRVYICDIILRELKINYYILASEQNNKLEKFKDDFERYRFNNLKIDSINIENSVKELTDFYEDLESKKLFTVLSVNNDFLPQIIDKAILKKKPFFDGKNELKDAIIWLTYSNLIETMKLEDNFLISENIHEFANKEKYKNGIIELNPCLIEECSRIVLYKSVKDFIIGETNKIHKVNERFAIWIENQNINEEFLIEIIELYFIRRIKEKVDYKLSSVDISRFLRSDTSSTGYLSAAGYDINCLNDFNITILENECIISVDLILDTQVDIYEYNSYRDMGEDSYSHCGITNLQVIVIISFLYDRTEQPRNLEIEDIEFYEV